MSHRTACTCMTEFAAVYKDAQFRIKSCRRSDDVAELKDTIEWLENHINDMHSFTTEMHEGAVAMEKRLMIYRSAIESLGFKRDLTAPKV